MRILITGGGGFVGRAVAARLAPAHELILLDRACAAPPGGRAVAGDLCDPATLDAALSDGVDAVIHLATVPGGAAEADPAEAWRVNVEGTRALLDAAARGGGCPRVIFASSIAVFGEPLPALVDDATPLRPRMVYGAHKALMEQWIATLTRRGAIRGLSLRLPGIVARPAGPSGMKSAFLSEIFHAAHTHRPLTLPVSPGARSWIMSVERVAANIVHALGVDAPEPFALTLPALRVEMAALVAEAARTAGGDPALVHYAPDPAIEAAFGSYPPLLTPMAEALGFTHDGGLPALVHATVRSIEEMP